MHCAHTHARSVCAHLHIVDRVLANDSVVARVAVDLVADGPEEAVAVWVLRLAAHAELAPQSRDVHLVLALLATNRRRANMHHTRELRDKLGAALHEHDEQRPFSSKQRRTQRVHCRLLTPPTHLDGSLLQLVRNVINGRNSIISRGVHDRTASSATGRHTAATTTTITGAATTTTAADILSVTGVGHQRGRRCGAGAARGRTPPRNMHGGGFRGSLDLCKKGMRMCGGGARADT
jgi:hypothetical protein